MSNVKERIVGAVTIMSNEDAEKVWDMIQATFHKQEETKMKFVYPAIFTPSGDEPGYTVVVLDLPGCVTEGDTLLEAIGMGVDAASVWILGELEEGAHHSKAS